MSICMLTTATEAHQTKRRLQKAESMRTASGYAASRTSLQVVKFVKALECYGARFDATTAWRLRCRPAAGAVGGT